MIAKQAKVHVVIKAMEALSVNKAKDKKSSATSKTLKPINIDKLCLAN